MHAKLLVSIVNWNNSAATNACLASIGRLPAEQQPDILLIDNHSTKERLTLDTTILDRLHDLQRINNANNLGFSGAHNQAIRYAAEHDYSFITLLNNDTELLDTNFFEVIITALQSTPEAIAAAPTVLSQTDPAIVWYGGGVLSTVTSYVSHLGVGDTYKRSDVAQQTVSFANGCCLTIDLRKASLSSLLLAEDYFVYWEDADWCARMKKAGFTLLYLPNVSLLHHVSSGLGFNSPSYIYYNIRNHFLFVRRNVSPVFWVLSWGRIGFISLKYLTVILLLRAHDTRLRSLRALWTGLQDGAIGKTGKVRRTL